MVSWLVIALAAVGIVAVVVVLVGSRRQARNGANRMVKAAFGVAVLWAAVSVAAAAAVALTALIAPQLPITVPVREFWPQLPTGTTVEGMTATIAGGGLTSADLRAEGLSVGVRICWALGQIAAWFVHATLAGLVAIVCSRLLRGEPFAPVVARAASIAAVAVLVGGLAAQIVGDVAGMMAASELLSVNSASWQEIPGIESPIDAWWPQPGGQLNIPFWPIAASLGFAALAAVFRQGFRLQRDTEGLV
jgi:hypothetical protein